MNRSIRCFAFLFAAALHCVALAEDDDASSAGGPQVFLDKNPRIIAYQLKRLSNAQLLSLERKATEAKYKPIFEAILTRKGLELKRRQEALAALVTINQSTPAGELLETLPKIDAEDKGTLAEVSGMLLAQPAATLKEQREKLAALVSDAPTPAVKQVAYAGLIAADGNAEQVWSMANENAGDLPQLLGAMPLVRDPAAREALYPRIREQAASPDEATRAAALEAISYAPGHEADSFGLLSGVIEKDQGPVREAAVRSIRRIPADKWPANAVAPLASAVVKLVEQTPADQRTTSQAAQMVQLGNELAAALPKEQAAPIRKSLRELGVRVVLIQTLREQMLYDLRYFAVQAGKPVQLVLENADAMPHNIVFTAPGAAQQVAAAGAAIPPPADAEALAYVPKSPQVLQATPLVNGGESAILNFTAPAEPGEYGYVCTFPGHAVRMYGTMLVVPDLETWEQTPSVPTDPMTKKPYESQKHTAGLPVEHEHSAH